MNKKSTVISISGQSCLPAEASAQVGNPVKSFPLAAYPSTALRAGRLPLTAYRQPLSANRLPLTVRSGITLIELLVVMVIMAIVLAISVPAFNSMGRGSDMRSAVSSVRATLAQSRQWAITHREQVMFRWTRLNETNPAYYYVTNAAGVVLQATNTIPLGVNFTSSKTVTFKTDGSLADGVTPVSIVITNVGGMRKTITIKGLTGGIQVE